MAAATITFEQHVQQNNERLVSIRQQLEEAGTFSSAAKELLEWVQDIRAFQKPFEDNLLQCLSVVRKLAYKEGYDLDLGYRLLSNCWHRKDRLSPEHAALLDQWNEELGQALLHRHPPTSQIMDPSSVLHNKSQQMMWSGNPGAPSPAGSVSVVTTVYPGTVSAGYPQGSYDHGGYPQQAPVQKAPVYPPSMAYRTPGNVPGTQQQGVPYSQAGYVPVQRGTPTGGQYGGPGPPGRAAMNAAKVAAAAVATATATAVAYENSQQIQSHQYDGQQMPMSYTPNGSQVYGQPHPGQMVQQTVGHGGMVPGQTGYPSSRIRMPNQQVYPGGGHPSQMAQMASHHMGGRGQVPPPQYPGHPASARMRAGMMGPRGPMVQYGPRGLQRVMRPVMYPGGSIMQAGGYMQNPAMMRQMSLPAGYSPSGPNGMMQGGMNGTVMPPGYPTQQQVRMMPQQPVDIKPDMSKIQMEEPRVTQLVRDGGLLPIFRLEHNVKVTEHHFTITEDVMQSLVQDPDSDIQLKCFHHDDKNHSNNWPHSNVNNGMFQPSVEVAVNGQPIPIMRVNQPLYIKAFCRPQQNTLQITVHQCCCSHFFVLQRVSRPSVDNIVRRLALRHENGKNFQKCVERIKRRFSQNPGSQVGAEIEQMSEKVSIRCPLGRGIIDYPARGANCTHIACFDLRNFLTFNREKTHLWTCPICQQQVLQDEIEIDSYFYKILHDLRTSESRCLVEDVIIFASGKWEQVQVPPTPIKQEPGGASESGYPAAKRFKSEPGGMNPVTCPSNYWNEISHPASVGPVTGLVGSPQQISGAVLSPYGPTSATSPAAQISQRSTSTPHTAGAMGPLTPGHAGRNAYGPPTPLTPSMQNPPSVGTVYPGTRSPIQSGMQAQTSSDGSVGSVTGSAPYTPASVGSQKGGGPGSEHQLQSGQMASDQSGGADLEFLFGDTGNNESGALGLLSEHELLQYLDQADFSAGQDFGSGPPQQQQMGTGGMPSSASDQQLANQVSAPPTSSSLASDADDILASFLD